MEYDDAPDGIIVKLWPAQIEPLFTVTRGKGCTVTFATTGAAAIHPRELVPVMIYVVFVDGLTLKEFPLIEYVCAPDGLIAKEPPLQMLPLLTLRTGNAYTVTVATAVLFDTHPAELVPVTE